MSLTLFVLYLYRITTVSLYWICTVFVLYQYCICTVSLLYLYCILYCILPSLYCVTVCTVHSGSGPWSVLHLPIHLLLAVMQIQLQGLVRRHHCHRPQSINLLLLSAHFALCASEIKVGAKSTDSCKCESSNISLVGGSGSAWIQDGKFVN